MSSDPINEREAMNETFDELYDQFEKQVDGLQTLLTTKSADYSGVHADHTWMNFVWAAEFANSPIDQIFYARMGEKIARLHSVIENQFLFKAEPNHESLDETLIDLAGYMVLLVAWHKFQKKLEQK